MRKFVAFGLIIAALAGFAGTCSVVNIRLTTIGAHKTFGGELKNDSGADLLAHNIRVTFFDANNNIVESKTTSGCLRSLQNGASDFFSVQTTGNGTDVKAAISALAFDSTLRAGATTTGNVSILNTQIHRNGSSLVVSGTLKNLDATVLNSPIVCVVVRDNNGAVVLVGKASTADLSHNASDAFTVTLTVPSDSTVVDHVDFWADGFEGGVPISPASNLDNNVAVCSSTATPTSTATGTLPTATASPVGTATAVPTTDPCS